MCRLSIRPRSSSIRGGPGRSGPHAADFRLTIIGGRCLFNPMKLAGSIRADSATSCAVEVAEVFTRVGIEREKFLRRGRFGRLFIFINAKEPETLAFEIGEVLLRLD